MRNPLRMRTGLRIGIPSGTRRLLARLATAGYLIGGVLMLQVVVDDPGAVVDSLEETGLHSAAVVALRVALRTAVGRAHHPGHEAHRELSVSEVLAAVEERPLMQEDHTRVVLDEVGDLRVVEVAEIELGEQSGVSHGTPPTMRSSTSVHSGTCSDRRQRFRRGARCAWGECLWCRSWGTRRGIEDREWLA